MMGKEINSYEFRVIWYYLTCGKTLKHPEAIRIMKNLGAKKKKDRYYVDLKTAAIFYYRKFKKVIDYRKIETPIELLYKALDYVDSGYRRRFSDIKRPPEYYYEGYSEEN